MVANQHGRHKAHMLRSYPPAVIYHNFARDIMKSEKEREKVSDVSKKLPKMLRW